MRPSHELSAARIHGLLHELLDRLRSEGIEGDIRLVGGAALVLSGISRRVTKDIDASYAPKADVERIIAQMARSHGLPPDWLNDNAKAFIPDEARWVDVEAVGGIRRADDRTLLAMKVAVERDIDLPDIADLARRLELSTPQQIVDVAFEQYGENSLTLSGTPENYLLVAEESLSLVATGPQPPHSSSAADATVWVEEHRRNGRIVRGHWRKRTPRR